MDIARGKSLAMKLEQHRTKVNEEEKSRRTLKGLTDGLMLNDERCQCCQV